MKYLLQGTLRAVCLAALAGWGCAPVAGRAQAGDAAAAPVMSRAEAVLEAERAMRFGDYRDGVEGYVAAAKASDNLETARVAALVAFDFGFDAAAIETAGRWAELAPRDPDPPLYEGLARLRSGDTDGALPLLFSVVEQASSVDDGIDALAMWDEVAMRAEFRFAAAEAIAERWPENAHAQRLAASAAFAKGDHDAALEFADRALELEPGNHKPIFLRASVLVARDDTDAALAIIEPFAAETASIEDRISAAIQYGRAERYSDALDVLNRILLDDPDNVEAVRASALIHVGSGNFESAAADFERLLGNNAHVDESLFYLATLAEREGQLSQAVRYYAQVDEGEYATLAQRRLAGMLRERRGTDAAIEHLVGFTERNPRYGLELSLARALLLAEDERYEDALALYDAYLEIRPGAESALLARANTVLESGDLDGAIGQYRAIVDRYPDSATALNALGYTLADRTRKFREAERLIDRALELDPDNPAVIDSKGWVLFKRGKLAEAKEYLQRAWDAFRDPEVGAHLGETLWRLGDEDAAREVLEEAWRRFPDDDVLRDTLERLIESGPVTRS